MNEMIIVIAIIALVVYGYWVMDRLDHFLYHRNDRHRISAGLRCRCKKTARQMLESISSLRRRIQVLCTGYIAHSGNIAIHKRHIQHI